jgi:tRNA U38,U39,U40 pseudouridine synthase TruA
MVDIGLGRRPLDDMALLLNATDNQETSPPAPPQGLYFVAAEYPAECYWEDGQTDGRTDGPAVSRTGGQAVGTEGDRR